MTQSAIPLDRSLDDSRNNDRSIETTEEVVYEYQVENPSFNRSPANLTNWLTSNSQKLASSNRSLIKTESTLLKTTTFNTKQDCSPSDYAVQTVQSFWKKLRN